MVSGAKYLDDDADDDDDEFAYFRLPCAEKLET